MKEFIANYGKRIVGVLSGGCACSEPTGCCGRFRGRHRYQVTSHAHRLLSVLLALRHVACNSLLAKAA